MQDFIASLAEHELSLSRRPLGTLQLNLGKRCNQACSHCHVDAGPLRSEMMAVGTVQRILELLDGEPMIETVDITGGAPELNPHFRYLVAELRNRGRRVIDRCNLTVLLEPGQQDTIEFLAAQRVHIISSLPCYTQEVVDRQRGHGVFDKSIEVLRRLNAVGYGMDGTGMHLDLVYNPSGPFLPPAQQDLEDRYRTELAARFSIRFNQLLTITNMPIKRFFKSLQALGQLETYQGLLKAHFNPEAALQVMCRDLLSVSWDGYLYDCDFNQMEGISTGSHQQSIWDIASFGELREVPIRFANHCYGCTAGTGSSCGGALAS